MLRNIYSVRKELKTLNIIAIAILLSVFVGCDNDAICVVYVIYLM